jgi:hypothetical protein
MVVAFVLGLLLLGVSVFGPPALRCDLVRSKAATLFPSLVNAQNSHSASAQSTSTPTPPPGASKPEPVRVMISASPPETQLFLDDQPVSNPLDDLRAPEGQVHVLRAEAPGRSTLTRAVTFDRDLTIFLELGHLTADPAAADAK